MKIKINKKLTISAASVIILVTLVSIGLNLYFVNKFYIYEKTKILTKISDEMSMKSLEDIQKNIDNLEKDNGIVISYTADNGNLDKINADIIYGFESKKIKLNKFWITEDTLNKLNYESVSKIYDQGIQKYKVLTKFVKVDGYIIAIGMPLPYMNDAIYIINKFNIYLNIFSIILIIVLVSILAKKITNPIQNLKVLSEDISNLNFRKEKIDTGDEIEELSESINSMSESLESAHNKINSQNEMLKELISDISHELKTPLALIKVYSQGIEDGLDDGTYIKTLEENIGNMDNLIERLLFWGKIEKNEIEKKYFKLDDMVINLLNKYNVLINEANIKVSLNVNKVDEYIIYEDKESIEVVLNNLITNSIKYTNNNEININIYKENGNIIFNIKNGIDKKSIDKIENIWRPFYVLEESRNKELSGTGLGLSIVKKILEKNNLIYGLNVDNGNIEMFIKFVTFV
ncbi:MAG: HAMP domain-containing sensor histidine kinase [Clostridium sp.]|uniref:HAMP domain-containing sensor histidine kinase n=1 Tax=Clostridium sp. TaxID=1506 RepID=UPI003F4163D2